MNLEERVVDALRCIGLTEGDRIAIACSGGADSVALVHLLARSSFVPRAVFHVDHGLRPDSEADARFVEETARTLGIQCDVARVAVNRRGSIEAAAREARYEALEQMAVSAGATHVATGHTVDDQAETVLLRLMRGGSLEGIAPGRGRFVRPLLGVARAELRDWLTANGVEWREDPSNTDLAFERNWVRSVLLPLVESRRPGATRVVARAADRAREDSSALDVLAAEVFARARVDDVGVWCARADLDLVPPAVRRRVIRTALRRVHVDPSEADVDRVERLASGRVSVGAVDVWRMHDGIAFVGDPSGREPDPLVLPRKGVVESARWGLRVRVGPARAERWRWRGEVPAAPVTIRARRPGDRIATAVGTRKVQDVLVDAKVPRPLRSYVPLLASGDRAVDVVGYNAGRANTATSGTVVDVDPLGTSWSRELVWISR